MHVEAERRAACCDLLSEVARHSGEVRLRLTGTSMLPSMWPGDVVTVESCKLTDLQPGQIVLYRANGGLIAHRVLHISADRLITRGDTVPHNDSPVDESAIVGRVAHILRNHRSIGVKHTWRHRTLSALLRRSHLCMRITLRLSSRTKIGNRSASIFASSETA